LALQINKRPHLSKGEFLLKYRPWAAYALGAMATTSLVTGCSGAGNPQLAPAAGAQANMPSTPVNSTLAQLTSVVSPKVKVQLRHVTGTHAIKPDCCAYAKTLFISDSGTNEVQMYDFPSNTYIGQLSSPPEGFQEPQGMCSDNKGDVYLANTGEESIDEFAHDGTYVQTLKDSGEYPVGCAFDKSTDNLAVSNIISTSDSAGSVAIYTKATGTPQIVSGGGFQRVFFLAYAGKTGVLYLDGENASYGFAYGSLKSGSIKSITVTGATINFPGTVNWSAQTQSMNIGDQDGAVLYQVSSSGKITGSTPLTGSSDIVQGTIKGPRFVGPDAGSASVQTYAYPAGGSAQSTITGLSEPIGSAVSPDVP
jgi:hypothetical protein